MGSDHTGLGLVDAGGERARQAGHVAQSKVNGQHRSTEQGCPWGDEEAAVRFCNPLGPQVFLGGSPSIRKFQSLIPCYTWGRCAGQGQGLSPQVQLGGSLESEGWSPGPQQRTDLTRPRGLMAPQLVAGGAG